ncbi:hypothetical protein ACA910_017108 [Epithemia clementina (nom. ined.)]
MATTAAASVMERNGSPNSSSSTVVVGLNAAFQKRFVLPPNGVLIPGDVHRAVDVQVGVGGKGQDVAIALSCLKYSPPIQLAQFLGVGAAGDTVYNLLQGTLGNGSNDDNSSAPNGVFDCTVRSQAPLRTCTSIVAADKTTELVEPSGTILPTEYEELFARLARVKVDALCIMGSMPPGCAEDTYARIYDTLASRPIGNGEDSSKSSSKSSSPFLCLIDSVAGLESLLETIRSHNTRKAQTRQQHQHQHQTILKINASEFWRLSGVEKKTVAETGGVELEELVLAVRALFQKWPHARDALDAIAISDGSHPGYFFSLPTNFGAESDQNSLEVYQIPVPSLVPDNNQQGRTTTTTTLYPIGAGDACAAGTLAAWKALSSADRNSNHPIILPSLLLQEQLVEAQRMSHPSMHSARIIMLISFAFGIACGSASCLQEQNSVLELADVERLFQTMVSTTGFSKLVSRESL